MVQVGNGVQSQHCCIICGSIWPVGNLKRVKCSRQWICAMSFDCMSECYWAIIIEGAHTGFLQNRDDSVILEAWGDYRQQQGEVKDVCEDICQYVSSMVSRCGNASSGAEHCCKLSGQVKWRSVHDQERTLMKLLVHPHTSFMHTSIPLHLPNFFVQS